MSGIGGLDPQDAVRCETGGGSDIPDGNNIDDMLRWNGTEWVSVSHNLIAPLSNQNPVMDGVADPGVDTEYARNDHVHPTDTTRAADNEVVKLSGDQSVGGVKTFTSIPVAPASDPTTDNQLARKKYVDDSLAILKELRAGVMEPFSLPESEVPTGAVLCFGQALTTDCPYRTKLIALGNPFGSSGSNPLVPDMRGRVFAGLDNMGGSDAGRLDWSNTLGGASGSQYHTLTVNEMPAHTHDQVWNNNATGIGSAAPAGSLDPPNWTSPSVTTYPTGGDQAHNNMQPTFLGNWIVWLGI